MYIPCSKVVIKDMEDSYLHFEIGKEFNTEKLVKDVSVNFEAGVVVVGCGDNLTKVYTSKYIEADVKSTEYPDNNIREVIKKVSRNS